MHDQLFLPFLVPERWPRKGVRAFFAARKQLPVDFNWKYIIGRIGVTALRTVHNARIFGLVLMLQVILIVLLTRDTQHVVVE